LTMFKNLLKEKKKVRKPEDGDFCYYPFMQILLTSDGKYRPCSKHQDYITHDGKVLHASEATLSDAWNSDYMQRIRQDFLNNRKFPGCSECWRLQSMGLQSMRYDSFQYNISEEQVQNPVQPVRIELNSSNVCNMRCRICYPNASSKWIKESKDLYGVREVIHKNLEGKNWEQVKEWADHLEEICFFGGEPLLSEDNMNLMEHLIEQGLSKKISLLFNTNGTIFTEDIAEKLLKFKRVRMYFSIDDIGRRFEYQRSGGKWDEVEQNIKKAYQLSRSPQGKKVIDFKICNTVSILNIYYFPEFFAYFSKNFPGLKIFWNLIFDPWRLSIQILPDKAKDVIRARLRNYLHVTFKMSTEETKTVDELIQYLDFQVDKPFGEFFRYVNRHDVYRKESFPEVFPEFWALLQPYKPVDVKMGAYDDIDSRRIFMLKGKSQFPNLAMLENYRDERKDAAAILQKYGHKEVVLKIVAAFREIACHQQQEGIFVTHFKDLSDFLLNYEMINQNFLQDILVSGAVKMYDALSDLPSKEVIKRLERKYSKEALV
jgi:MoaA/NifB/PqqE/SkfB family radical SAM enzyme